MNNEKIEKGFSTPRINGEGDGIRQKVSSRKRVPIASSRKFTAYGKDNENIRLRLQDALEKAENKHMRVKRQASNLKSSSVAEITPTKSKKKRSIQNENDNISTAVMLYATPRPLDDGNEASRRQRRCSKTWAECFVYRRLLLAMWRRSKDRQATLHESCRRQKDQIAQMEIQIDVLKRLRNSECENRDLARNECQKLQKNLDDIELENNTLFEEMQKLRTLVDVSHHDLKSTKTELKFLAEQLLKTQEQLKKKREQKKTLEETISIQQTNISMKASKIAELEDSLKSTLTKLHKSEAVYRLKEEAFDDLLIQLKKEIDKSNSLTIELSALKQTKNECEKTVQILENELDNLIDSYQDMRMENEDLRNTVNNITLQLEGEKKKNWFKNTKELALLSLSALQKIAYIMLPAYLDFPEM